MDFYYFKITNYFSFFKVLKNNIPKIVNYFCKGKVQKKFLDFNLLKIGQIIDGITSKKISSIKENIKMKKKIFYKLKFYLSNEKNYNF